jgi:predicted RNA-binding protein YlqC (UPF0109 family)
MSSIDQQFVEFIVKSLVSNPDAVIVERRIDEKGVLLELTVDPEDLGRVIGKRGATAQSLRTLLRALGTKNDARYNLKIVDNGMPVEGGADGEVASVAAPVASSAVSDDDDVVADDSGSRDRNERDDEVDEDSRVSKTRRELADLDDLDV